MKSFVAFAAVCFAFTTFGAKPELVSVRKIWDRAGHNAFTDLIRFQDRWFCTFREADAHVGSDGKLRILQSTNGSTWESAALLDEPGIDLRDPKLSITPAGKLMLTAEGSVYHGTKTLQSRQPRVAFSSNGREWSPIQRILNDGEWLWRVTWHDGIAYGISYGKATNNRAADHPLKLYTSRNGTNWNLAGALDVPGSPNETTLRFLRNGDALALIRREVGDEGGWIGRSSAPYTDWKFSRTTIRLGGPDFIQLPDGSLVAGSRDFSNGKPQCSLFRMTTDSLQPVLTLPSGGDCSYPGLVWHDGLLWVSYYSSHAGKASIYLAKVKWPLREPPTQPPAAPTSN